jgi:hypothetical protein
MLEAVDNSLCFVEGAFLYGDVDTDNILPDDAPCADI